MYQIGIFDDEPIFSNHTAGLLTGILSAHGIPCRVHIFQTGSELSAFLSDSACQCPHTQKLDLLLLDILLGEENGIELAKSMRRCGSTIPILFITNSTDFVYEGYEAEPVGYLLKPVDPKKLEEALLRAYKKYKQKTATLHTPVQTISFQLDDTLYMEINNKTLSIHLTDGNILKAAAGLYALSDILPPEQFVQCHRSYIVSLAAISSIRRYTIELKNQEIIPVSKKRFKEVQNAFLAWAVSL